MTSRVIARWAAPARRTPSRRAPAVQARDLVSVAVGFGEPASRSPAVARYSARRRSSRSASNSRARSSACAHWCASAAERPVVVVDPLRAPEARAQRPGRAAVCDERQRRDRRLTFELEGAACSGCRRAASPPPLIHTARPVCNASLRGSGASTAIVSDRLLGAVPVQALRRRVPARDDAVRGLRHDRVARGRYDGRQPPLRLARLRLDRGAVGP